MVAKDLIPEVCEKIGIDPACLSLSEICTLEFILEKEWRFIIREASNSHDFQHIAENQKSPEHNEMHEWLRVANVNGVGNDEVDGLFCTQANLAQDKVKVHRDQLLYCIWCVLLNYAEDDEDIGRAKTMIDFYAKFI